MSVQTYNYDFKFPFNLKGNVNIPLGTTLDDGTVIADVVQGLNTVAAQKFAEKMAPTGHWYRVNSTTTTVQITNKSHVAAQWVYEFQGTTVLNFDTDVADPTAHNSPQLEAVIIAILGAILTAIVTYPLVFLIIVAIIVFTVGAWILINTGTGAIYQLGNNAGSLAITLGILVVTGLVAYGMFFTKQGRKAARKGYQTARRGYHAVRRRIR